MIHRTEDDIIQAYFASEIPSQSRLKLLLKGVHTYNAAIESTEDEVIFYEEKSHFLVGQAAETLAQYGQDKFDRIYYMSDVPKPSDTIMSIMRQFFDIQIRTHGCVIHNDLDDKLEANFPFDEAHNDLMEAIEFHNYSPKWGRDAKLKNIIKPGLAYYKDLEQAFGKQILSLDQSTVIQEIAKSWKENPRTARYFQETEGVDLYYQFPIYFEFMGETFKALLDIFEIDHNKKTLTPIDLKTMAGDTIQFPGSMRSFRYDFQGCFYANAVNAWRKKHPEISDYRVNLPIFVVETTNMGLQGSPLVFQLSNEVMNMALYGRQLMSMGIHYTETKQISKEVQTSEIGGIIEAINLYKWHVQNGFQYDKVVVDYDGEPLTLDWEGIRRIK